MVVIERVIKIHKSTSKLEVDVDNVGPLAGESNGPLAGDSYGDNF